MVLELTADDQAVARAMFGGWRGVRAMAYRFDIEKDGAVSGMMGCSNVVVRGGTGWGHTRPQGLGWSVTGVNSYGDPDSYDIFVSWTRLAAHFAQHRESALVVRCAENSRRTREIAAAGAGYPGRWRGVPFVVPRNRDQLTYEEYDHWWKTVHMPEFRAAQAEQSALLDRIYPATATDAEPADLIALLMADPS